MDSVLFFTTAKRHRLRGNRSSDSLSIENSPHGVMRTRLVACTIWRETRLAPIYDDVPVRRCLVYRLPVHINCFHNSDQAYVIQRPCCHCHLPRGRTSNTVLRSTTIVLPCVSRDFRLINITLRRLLIPTFRKPATCN